MAYGTGDQCPQRRSQHRALILGQREHIDASGHERELSTKRAHALTCNRASIPPIVPTPLEDCAGAPGTSASCAQHAHQRGSHVRAYLSRASQAPLQPAAENAAEAGRTLVTIDHMSPNGALHDVALKTTLTAGGSPDSRQP
jgi:hypothetical protein